MRTVSWRRRVLVGLATALLWPMCAAVTGAVTPAHAAYWPAGMDFWVDSSMGPIKSRIFRAADGNTQRVVYALDGMRATNDISGWEHETNIAQTLTAWNMNVVMPVGGQSSFYTDWNAPSNFNGQQRRYMWETFLTRELPEALSHRLHFQSVRNGVFGLSMGGSAALVMAAYHPEQFNYAGSFSGFLHLTAPGMPEAIRVGMLDAGNYNVDAMWGAPYSEQWQRNDPMMFAQRLKDENIRCFIASGNGIPGRYDVPHEAMDLFHTGVQNMPLEILAFATTKVFELRMMQMGAQNVVWRFPAAGVHNWPYWVEDVNAMIPDMSAHIG